MTYRNHRRVSPRLARTRLRLLGAVLPSCVSPPSRTLTDSELLMARQRLIAQAEARLRKTGIKDLTLAEDAAQDAIVEVLEHDLASQVDPAKGDARRFLAGVLRHTTAAAARRRIELVLASVLDGRHSLVERTAPGGAAVKEVLEAVEHWFRKLPARRQRALVERFPWVFGLKPSGTKRRNADYISATRALDQLRDWLKRFWKGFDDEAGGCLCPA